MPTAMLENVSDILCTCFKQTSSGQKWIFISKVECSQADVLKSFHFWNLSLFAPKTYFDEDVWSCFADWITNPQSYWMSAETTRENLQNCTHQTQTTISELFLLATSTLTPINSRAFLLHCMQQGRHIWHIYSPTRTPTSHTSLKVWEVFHNWHVYPDLW